MAIYKGDKLVSNIGGSSVGGVGVEEAPQDGKVYMRKDGAWVEIPPGESVLHTDCVSLGSEAPDGSKTTLWYPPI